MKQKIILTALANPIRIKILNCLSEKPKSVDEMIKICNISQSAVSQHLARLRTAGLVTTKKKGRFIYYQVKNNEIKKISKLLEKFLAKE